MSRPLRIAMLAHSTNPRGGVVHAMQVAEALHRQGHEVTLFAPDSTGDGFFRTPRCRASAFPVGPAPAGALIMVERRIEDYVEHLSAPAMRGFDVYHAHDGISGNALAILEARGLIAGFARTVHHVDDFANARLNALQARSISAADACFAVSPLWRDYLAEAFGIAAAVCGNGVDRVRFRPEPDGREVDLRERLGLGLGPIFLCVGGVEERKNTVCMLEAFRQVLATRPDAELAIAGGASLLDHDAYQRRFAGALAGFGQSARSVRRLGVIADADMPGLYRAASALVFASVKEGFGLCVVEAMACGAPVVVSRIRPFTDYFGPSDAIWCDPLEPRSIADAMRLSLDENRRERLRLRGLEIASKFNWDEVARTLTPAYRRFEERAVA